MIRSITGLIHTIAAGCALVSGLVIFRRPKATLFHRALGYTYSSSMVILIVTAFFIYHLTKSFNVLHIFAIVACPPLILGLSAAMTQRPKGQWLMRHYYWMGWSYVGLCAALLAEVATRIVMPYVYVHFGWRSKAFFIIVGVASFVVSGFGGYFIERNRELVQRFNTKGPNQAMQRTAPRSDA